MHRRNHLVGSGEEEMKLLNFLSENAWFYLPIVVSVGIVYWVVGLS